MRQVNVVLTCDPCMAWKEREVTTDVVTVNVSAGQTLDLCPEHRDALARVWALVAEWGAAQAGPAKVRRTSAKVNGATVTPEAAPAETAATAPRNRRGGKRARARRTNAEGASTDATAPVDAPPGSYACPLCDHLTETPHGMAQHLTGRHHVTATEVYGSTCPVCNREGTGRALGVHAKQHGASSVYALFAMATAAGDPHAVIARRADTFAAMASATP